MTNKWLRIGLTMLVGLFVAYLDRSNLSIGLRSMSQDLGFSGAQFAVTSSMALTSFLIGYAVSNFFGGILSSRINPKKLVVGLVAFWSLATLLTGFIHSVTLLNVLRFMVGIGEGVYWPQQTRFVRAWFTGKEYSRANAMIQYYGQFLALSLGFVILTPISNSFGWRPLFYITGALGLLVVVPLYAKFLKASPDESSKQIQNTEKEKLTFKSLGGYPYLLLIYGHLANGMLFWGVTLWIPLVVRSLGFTGLSQGFASSLPYFLAILFAIPITIISDRTGKRIVVVALGLIIGGILLVFLGMSHSNVVKLLLISFGTAYYAASYSTNIWTVITTYVGEHAVAPAIGIVNGIGVGLGGIMAGWLVGLLYKQTGSFLPGFIVLGAIAVTGGLGFLWYGKLMGKKHTSVPLVQALVG